MLPPLRKRKDDIPVLVRELLGAGGPSVTPAAVALLVEHEWPGNVRELRNVLERARSMTHTGRRAHADRARLRRRRRRRDARRISRGEGSPDRDVGARLGHGAAQARAAATSRARRALGQLDRVSLHRLMKKHGIAAREE